MKSIQTIEDSGCVCFVRLVYSVFYVQENSALSSLQIRGVSAIQSLKYNSMGDFHLGLHYKVVVHYSRVPTYRD